METSLLPEEKKLSPDALSSDTRRRSARSDDKNSRSIIRENSSNNIEIGDISRESSWDDVSLDDSGDNKRKHSKSSSPTESVFQIGLQVQLYCRRGLERTRGGKVSSKTKLKHRKNVLFSLVFMLFICVLVYWRLHQYQLLEQNNHELGSSMNPLIISEVPDHLLKAASVAAESIEKVVKPKAPPRKIEQLIDAKDYKQLVKDSTGLPNVKYGCGHTARDVDEIQIHVIVWRRPTSTERLFNQLKDADYSGWDKQVDLYIHMDGGGSNWVKNICNRLEWKYGEKILDFRTDNIGLRGIWLTSLEEASREAGDNTLMVVLEDDIRVSDSYFQGLLAMIDAYGRNRDCRDKNLMGFSLSPIKLEELRKPFTRWNAAKALGERANKANRHIAYLTSVPSSWGAAYWSDRWEEFANFCDHRVKPPFFDHNAEAMSHHIKGNYDSLTLTPKELQVPDSRSNLWPKSWKRFLVDFMYARGLVMLYPSLPREQGFATTLALSGEHVWSPNTSKTRKANPRITSLIENFELPKTGVFPVYGDLAVFDLHLELTTREDLVVEGARFLHSVRDNCRGDCQDLLNHWARPETFSDDDNEFPTICAADVYMPSSADDPAVAKTIHLAPKQKYLLFEPSYGGNNQLHAIVEALYWASVLDRKLIVPPIFLPRVSEFDFTLPLEEWPVTEAVLDFGNLNEKILEKHIKKKLPLPNKQKPIGFKEWMDNHRNTTSPISRILRLSRDALFDKPSRKLTETLNPDGEIMTINLRHLFDKTQPSADQIRQYLGGCQDEVLTFEGMFFADIANVNKYILAADVATLSNRSEKIYKKVKKKVLTKLDSEEYTCFHVRLGDFSDMCSSQAISKIPFYNDLKRSGYACETTLEQVKESIIANEKPVFIMSDNATALEEVLPESNKFVTSEWVQGLIMKANEEFNSAELDLLSMSIEQQLCKDAESAVLNKYSTVSRRIENLRYDQGVTYWKRKEKKREDYLPGFSLSDILMQEGDSWKTIDGSSSQK